MEFARDVLIEARDGEEHFLQKKAQTSYLPMLVLVHLQIKLDNNRES